MSNTGEGKPAGKSGQRSRKGERGKKTVSKKGPPESPAPVQLQSPDQDQPLQPQPVHAESPKVDEPPTHPTGRYLLRQREATYVEPKPVE